MNNPFYSMPVKPEFLNIETAAIRTKGRKPKGRHRQKADMDKRLNVDPRKKLYKNFVWSVFLCRSDTWTLGEVDKKIMEAFEMWCHCKKLNILWMYTIEHKEEIIEHCF